MVFDGGAGDLNSSLCTDFCFDVWFYLLEKNLFVREIFCKMQNTDSPEQVRWYTHSVRMSISSEQCCLFPESVGIYLEYVKQGRDALNEANQPIPVAHICN